MDFRSLAACLMLAAASPLFAQAPAPASSPPPPPPPHAPVAKIADVAWLQGYWDGEGMGGTVEDIWMPPREGTMPGAFRLIRPHAAGGNLFWLVAIQETGASLTFAFRHVLQDFTALEEKDKALRLPLTAITPTTATFAGVVFRQVERDVLEVDLTRRGADGVVKVETMRLRKRAL